MRSRFIDDFSVYRPLLSAVRSEYERQMATMRVRGTEGTRASGGHGGTERWREIWNKEGEGETERQEKMALLINSIIMLDGPVQARGARGHRGGERC